MTAAFRHSVVCLLAFFSYYHLVRKKKLKIINPTVKNGRNEARNLKKEVVSFYLTSKEPVTSLLAG